MITAIIAAILEWLLQKLIDLGLVEAKKISQDSHDEEIAKADADLLKKAQTEKEKEDAARTINNHTF